MGIIIQIMQNGTQNETRKTRVVHLPPVDDHTRMLGIASASQQHPPKATWAVYLNETSAKNESGVLLPRLAPDAEIIIDGETAILYAALQAIKHFQTWTRDVTAKTILLKPGGSCKRWLGEVLDHKVPQWEESGELWRTTNVVARELYEAILQLEKDMPWVEVMIWEDPFSPDRQVEGAEKLAVDLLEAEGH